MTSPRPRVLDRPVNPRRDHVLGPADAEVTLVEYGSYACKYCHAAHEVIGNVRDRLGGRMRYVFRHLPIRGELGTRTAELAEYAAAATGQFWPVHDELMRRGPDHDPSELDRIAELLQLPPRDANPQAAKEAAARVAEDTASAHRSGAAVTPTFFINGRRYEGPWDESALVEAMLGSLGHRVHAATLDFASWAPSTGLLLLVATVIAIALTNSSIGPAFTALWETPLGISFGDGSFSLSLLDWIDHGLLSVFFLVVGLEIKREFTVGRLATRRGGGPRPRGRGGAGTRHPTRRTARLRLNPSPGLTTSRGRRWAGRWGGGR